MDKELLAAFITLAALLAAAATVKIHALRNGN